ncbi:glycosyltransferase family 2 protein [Mucilaginibacter sp. BT774]|uniref:glycosyltransferase family 2 protein n=1 Tax=Mucilaginibacter sp. BT774 TaxID=3062276 RepID=UPI002674D0E9|nr:glycosyltransferase family 2 protein [Mucilaginibacter sp. BT774]MDO3627499.1 glycosyltransferase family 2 protein [Mucilaginibacter sp. BT774]
MSNISFFIPAYNCASTIIESVDSIMKTNFVPGDELIVVNDHSSDQTGEVLSEVQKTYPVIRIITHIRNKGGAAARNTAVESATNPLLFCLDSDNVLAPFSIGALKEYLLLLNADVASFEQQRLFKEDMSSPVDIWKLPPGELPIDCYLTGENAPGQHGNYLFTKESWMKAQGYAEGTGALDTWTFGLRQAITGAKMVVLKDTWYFHRVDHETSYWMRDAEANLWSVSLKASYALFPFYDMIEEEYLNYILGPGKYTWFHNRKARPIRLVGKGSKDLFYKNLHQKIVKRLYPKPTLIKRGINKLTKVFKNDRS